MALISEQKLWLPQSHEVGGVFRGGSDVLCSFPQSMKHDVGLVLLLSLVLLSLGAVKKVVATEAVDDHGRAPTYVVTMLPGEVRMFSIPVWSDGVLDVEKMDLPCRCIAVAEIGSLRPGDNNIDIIIDAPLSEMAVRGDILLIGSDQKGQPAVKTIPIRVNIRDFIEVSPRLRRGELIRLNDRGLNAVSLSGVEYTITAGSHPTKWNSLRLENGSDDRQSRLHAELRPIGDAGMSAYQFTVSLRPEEVQGISGYFRENLAIQAIQNVNGQERQISHARYPLSVLVHCVDSRIYAVPGRLVLGQVHVQGRRQVVVSLQGSEVRRIAGHTDRITSKNPSFHVVNVEAFDDSINVVLSLEVKDDAPNASWEEIQLDFGLDGLPLLSIPIVFIDNH